MPPRRRAGSRRGALSDDFRSALDAKVQRLQGLETPLEQVTAVGDFCAELDYELERVAKVRLDAFKQLRREGWTYP